MTFKARLQNRYKRRGMKEEMDYMHILTIAVKHNYFNNGLCPSLIIAPSYTTAKKCGNNGVILKTRQNKLKVLAEESYLEGLSDSVSTLFLTLHTSDPSFCVYTNIDTQPGKNMIYKKVEPVTNTVNREINKNDLIRVFSAFKKKAADIEWTEKKPVVTLPDGTTEAGNYLGKMVAAQDMQTFDEGIYEITKAGPASDKFLLLHQTGWHYPPGCIEIPLKNLTVNSQKNEPVEVSVELPERKVFWCYNLVSENREKLEKSTLKVSDGLVAFLLEGIYDFKGGKMMAQVCSSEKISLKQRYSFNIELYNNLQPGHTTILPYPQADGLSVLKRGDKNELCTNIYYYL